MPHGNNFIWACSCPINFDTYIGCTHGCAYCFANFRKPSKAKKTGINVALKRGEGVKALLNFINGERGSREAWADWDIPLCWGRSADPFPPEERKLKYSLEALEIFAETKYPFIVTTKSTIPTEEPYYSLFKQCKCIIQFSMCCSKYDKMEQGAPHYVERLKALEIMSQVVPRTMARWQPLFLEFVPYMIGEIPKIAKAGAHGIMVERGKLLKPKGECNKRIGRYYTYPIEKAERAFYIIAQKCHENGLVFTSGDLMQFSDTLECCGTEGLEGFHANKCTAIRLLYDPKTYTETEKQKEKGTGVAFRNSYCDARYGDFKDVSFAGFQKVIYNNYKDQYDVFI